MGVRQYVGARYVPKFADPVAWQSGTSYEALTIVTYNNNSFTSKIPVPATVGNPADNPTYWVETGNYNAQVEDYRQTALQAQETADEANVNIENLTKLVNTIAYTPEMFNGVGDGTTDDTVALNNMFQKAATDNIPVILGSKTYLVTNTINTQNVTILPSTGIIKASEAFPENTVLVLSSNIIQGSSGTPDQDNHTFTVQYLRVNGNDKADTGIKVQYICGGILNYEIYNCVNKGIDISNCLDCVFDIDVKNQNTLGNYGCYIDDNDNTFNNILVTNYNTGVYVTGVNYFKNIHYWLGIITNYENSTAVNVVNNGSAFGHIYADTCKNGIVATANSAIAIAVGSYIYVNNTSVLPTDTYDELHIMFHATNPAYITVNQITCPQYYIPPKLLVTDTVSQVAVSSNGYGLRTYSQNAGFTNNISSFTVTTNASPAYENMPTKLKTEHPTTMNAEVLSLGYLLSGSIKWLCIDPTYNRFFFTKQQQPTENDWFEFNDVRYEQIEVTCETNSSLTLFTTYGVGVPTLTTRERLISAQILDSSGDPTPAIASIVNTGSNAYKAVQVYGTTAKTYTVLIGISTSALF